MRAVQRAPILLSSIPPTIMTAAWGENEGREETQREGKYLANSSGGEDPRSVRSADVLQRVGR